LHEHPKSITCLEIELVNLQISLVPTQLLAVSATNSSQTYCELLIDNSPFTHAL